MNAMEYAILKAKGYGEVTFRVLGPRMVVASSHKLVNGQPVTAEALGLDRIDAERKLVKVVTRP